MKPRASYIRRRHRAMLAKKPKAGSRRALIVELDSLSAQIVKIRDGFECVQCRDDGVQTRGILDCGHLYPKSAFPAGRFLLSNLFSQCRAHNVRHIGRPEFFFTWYLKFHTHGQLEELHAQVLGKSPTALEMEALAVERRATLEQMRLDAEVAA
jgi:hypothetical protein